MQGVLTSVMSLNAKWRCVCGIALPGIGCKLPHCERLKVGKGSGCLEDRGTHYVLWWPCSSSPLEFAMVLSVSKRIPKEELIKVAESTSDIRE